MLMLSLLSAQEYQLLTEEAYVSTVETEGMLYITVRDSYTGELFNLPAGCYKQEANQYVPLFFAQFCVDKEQNINGIMLIKEEFYDENDKHRLRRVELIFRNSEIVESRIFDHEANPVMFVDYKKQGEMLLITGRDSINGNLIFENHRDLKQNELVYAKAYFPDGKIKSITDNEKGLRQVYAEDGKLMKESRPNPERNNEIFTTTYHPNGKIDSLYNGIDPYAASNLKLFNELGEMFFQYTSDEENEVFEYFQQGFIHSRSTTSTYGKSMTDHFKDGKLSSREIQDYATGTTEYYDAELKLVRKSLEYVRNNEVFLKTTDAQGKIISDEKIGEIELIEVSNMTKETYVEVPPPPPSVEVSEE